MPVPSAATPHHVLLYAMNYHPEFAGVGKYTGELAQMLADMGCAVTVVTTPPHYPGWSVAAGYRNRYAAADVMGIRVLRCPLLLRRTMGGLWRVIAPVTFAITSAPVFLWAAIRRRPALILCIEPTLAVAPVALAAARMVGARTLLHVQDLEVDAAFAVGHVRGPAWVRRSALAAERIILRRFDRLLTISGAMAQRLAGKDIPPERISILHNWVDLERFGPAPNDLAYRRELGLPETAFLVLYSGNVGAKQGLDQLLDAARILSDRSDIHFAIAGEGPARDPLRKRYGHLRNVSFLPFQPVERLNAFLNLADLHALIQSAGAADLVLPSKLGGMLATGHSVVVTAEADTELATFLEGQATIVPPGDPVRLARAIAEVADTPSQDRAVARPATREMLAASGARRTLRRLVATLIPLPSSSDGSVQ